jgi:hypothetical protein
MRPSGLEMSPSTSHLARLARGVGQDARVGPDHGGYDEVDAARPGVGAGEPRGGPHVAGLDVLVPWVEGRAVQSND